MTVSTESLADLCGTHMGTGRATLGRLLGGQAEVSSSGAWVHANDGRSYLDFGGYGVFILGHRHPAVVAAVHQQIDLHPLSSRVFFEPTSIAAAAALAQVAPVGMSMVHFVNSGAEATEAALKLARAAGKSTTISMRNGFHGKTLGALSVTANNKYQDAFRPLLPNIVTVNFGDLTELRTALAAAAGQACVIVEPVQGEAGVIIPPPGYLNEVATLCRQHGALLIVDEIQTGLGRLGSWWGIDTDEVHPDILLAGKGLSGGVVPVAAMIARPEIYAPFADDPYLHSSTFAASPLACAAAKATIEVMLENDIPRRAAEIGSTLMQRLRQVIDGTAHRERVVLRGRGLLIGIEIAQPGAIAELFLNLIDHGILSNHSLNSSTVLRLTPPAILTDQEINTFVDAFDDALSAVEFA